MMDYFLTILLIWLSIFFFLFVKTGVNMSPYPTNPNVFYEKMLITFLSVSMIFVFIGTFCVFIY